MPNSPEKRKELIRQYIIALKEVWDAEDFTEADILQKMLDAGETTSISTVHRLYVKGSENNPNFNYNLTIKPFVRVFLKIPTKPIKIENLSSEDEKEKAILANTVQMKDATIADLEAQIAVLTKECTVAQQQIKYLIKESERKDKLLDERREFILDLQNVRDRFRKTTIILYGLLILSLVGIIFALATDSILPLL